MAKFRSVSFLLFAWFSAAPLMASAEETRLQVGFIGALSGPAASYGQSARNGLELALSETTGSQIDVTYEDDQFSPPKAVAAFQRLTLSSNLDVALCMGSPSCNAIAPLAESRKIPLFAMASDCNVALGRKWVLRTFPSGEAEGNTTLEEARKRGFRDVAVFTAIHDYALSWRAGVVDSEAKVLVIMDEQVPPDLKSFLPLLTRAKQSGVKDLLLCLAPGQSGQFAKNAHEMGLKSQIGGCIFLEDPGELKSSGGALAPAWFVTIPVTSAFKERYQQRYGNGDSISAAAVYYDLGKALLSVGARQPETLIRRLVDAGYFQGVGGRFTVVSKDGDTFFDYPLQAVPVVKDDAVATDGVGAVKAEPTKDAG